MKLGKLSANISEFEKSLSAPNARTVGGFGTGSQKYEKDCLITALAKIKEQDEFGKFQISDVKLPFVMLESELSRTLEA